MGIPTTNTGNLEQRRLLYQKYGYDINKLIRTHEKHESRNQHEDGVNNDGFIILNAKSDKLDYQRLFEASNKDIYASNNVSHKNNKSKRRGNNDQGFRKFTKVSTSFRKLEEESAKRSRETSWVLKDVLKYIKYRSQRLDPFITKWFTPKGITNTSTNGNGFLLRLVEFGEPTSNGDTTALLSDATHKLCVIFPRKTVFNYITNGGLQFQDAYSINNYIYITKANLKFVTHEFIKTHFGTKLNYIDTKVSYCVLQVLEFKLMYSVEYLLANRVAGAPPLEKVVNDNGSQYEVYDYEDFDVNGGANGGDGGGGNRGGCGGAMGQVVPRFDKFALKLVYNNELYRKLCYLKPLER